MLARENRLRSAADIARVYKRGAYGGSGGALSVKAVKSGRLQSRAVVVVGKKVSKRAVVRNRIRRRLIEELRGRWATVTVGYDIVLSVHADISEAPASELREHLVRALGRAGISAS
jgi:ribonuclease P protein component